MLRFVSGLSHTRMRCFLLLPLVLGIAYFLGIFGIPARPSPPSGFWVMQSSNYPYLQTRTMAQSPRFQHLAHFIGVDYFWSRLTLTMALPVTSTGQFLNE